MRCAPHATVRISGMVMVSLLLASRVQAADPTGSGPERAMVYSESSLSSHTIYRPADLKGRYPVVLWGNGSCVDSSFGYREFLAEIASHGFIVLAIGPYRDSPAPRQSARTAAFARMRSGRSNGRIFQPDDLELTGHSTAVLTPVASTHRGRRPTARDIVPCLDHRSRDRGR